ncbi:MAG: hypothetical protein HY308_19545 [Gammaproteobacteria bacterium]|nr:hypothetical protein [Gammaproteobacteria bacterium]
MNKVGKLLLVILLLILAAYAGLKTYIKFQARSSIDRAIENVAMFVDIKYRSIGSDLIKGSIEIDDIKITPRGINDTVSIRQAALETGNLRYLFRLSDTAKKNEIPDNLTIALRGLHADMDGQLLALVDQPSAQRDSRTSYVYNCGDEPVAMNIALLRRLGYSELTMDLVLNYTLNKQAEVLRFSLDFDMQDIHQLKMNAKLSGVNTDFKNRQQTPQLREMEFLYKDLSYYQRLKNFCSQQAKISAADYVKAESAGDSLVLRQLGIVPGPGLREAYAEFLTNAGSEFKVRVASNEDINPKSLPLFKPADVLALLNAEVSINGKPVKDLSFDFRTRAEPVVAKSDTGQEATAATLPGHATPTTPTASKEPVSAEPGFRAVPIADLGRYLNRYVRITEIGQPSREGELIEIAGKTAIVQRYYNGGNILIRVPLIRIDKIEVMFE